MRSICIAAALAALALTGALAQAGPARALATASTADTTPPTAPASFVRTAVTVGSLTVYWSPSTDAVGVTGYRVFLDGTLILSPGVSAGRTFTVTGLTCGHDYTLAVEARDAAGNTSDRTVLETSSAACPPDTAPPSAPSFFNRTSATPTSITVGWSAADDRVGVAGYGIYMSGARIGTQPASDPRTTTFTGLVCARSYVLGLDAYDAAGNRSGRVLLATTTAACPDIVAPTAPPAFLRSTSTATSLTVTWKPSTDAFGVIGYGLYLDGTQVGSAGVNRAYTFTGLTCEEPYELAVDAFDSAGNRSSQTLLTASTACPDTTPPASPTLALAATAPTSLRVTWSAPADAVGFGVYRDGARVANLARTTRTYTFAVLACASDYELSIDAVDAAGNRSPATPLDATTATCPPDTKAPSMPLPSWTGSGATSLTVTWTQSFDNVGLAGYGFYVGTTLAGGGPATDRRRYTYTGLACGRSYKLAVDAVDAAGNRSARRTVTARTGACP